MTYAAFRVNDGPTQHSAHFYPVTADVLEAGFILAFCILGISFFLVVPGFPGIKRLYFLIRVAVGLFIGSAILLGVIGQEWELAEIETKTPYKVFSTTEINATVGAKIGLGSVNITLKGHPVEQLVDQTHLVENNTYWIERIDYNERFHWAWRQGRFGFGPYSGRINQEFRQAQYKGLPIPILWVAEYFTLDGELIRWGRSYRTAGWYTYQVLWTAFPLWIISNILSVMCLSYCGVVFMMTGGCMLTSIIIYSTIRWGTQPLVIPFEHGSLEFHYGSSFWLTMVGGAVAFLYGFIIWCMDKWAAQVISDFFDIDVLKDTAYFYQREEVNKEEPQMGERSTAHTGGVAKRINRAQSRWSNNTISRTLAKKSRRTPRQHSHSHVHPSDAPTFSALSSAEDDREDNPEEIYENESAIRENEAMA
ncbi:dual oxidase maturation factor 1-like isoform X2 [Styela clava]